MTRIAVISGGLGVPSSTRTLGDLIITAAQRQQPGLEATTIELRGLAHPIVDAMLTGFPMGQLAQAIEQVAQADALVAVSPTFSASMSGLFKSFFDILEPGTLRGKPVLLAATGGSQRHSLMLEFAMRPLFAYLGAWPTRTGIFAATADFGGTGLDARVDEATRELLGSLTGQRTGGADDGFTEFSQLLDG